MENQKDKEAFWGLYSNSGVECEYTLEYNNAQVQSEVTIADLRFLIDRKNSFLLLKSLENISDEDAKKCRFPNEKAAKDFVKKKQFVAVLDYEAIDYLRLQSYLLPFRNYTIEQILEIGWAKIQN